MAQQLLLALALFLCTAFFGRGAALSTSSCLPHCDAQHVLQETVKQLRPRPEGNGQLACQVHVRTRPEALDCLRGKWVISIGNSWAQAMMLALLQVRARAHLVCHQLTSSRHALRAFSFLIHRQRRSARVGGIMLRLKT